MPKSENISDVMVNFHVTDFTVLFPGWSACYEEPRANGQRFVEGDEEEGHPMSASPLSSTPPTTLLREKNLFLLFVASSDGSRVLNIFTCLLASGAAVSRRRHATPPPPTPAACFEAFFISSSPLTGHFIVDRLL
jgi:hypothetical protein